MSDQEQQTKPDGGASASTAGLGGSFGEMATALSGMIEMEALIERLMVLGVEYQTGNIRPERFAMRTHELLVSYQKTRKTPNVELRGAEPASSAERPS